MLGPQHGQRQGENNLQLSLLPSMPPVPHCLGMPRVGWPGGCRKGCTLRSPHGRKGDAETPSMVHGEGPLGAELLAGLVLVRAEAPEAGGQHSLCPRWFLSPAHTLPPSLCMLNKKGEQALPSASLIRQWPGHVNPTQSHCWQEWGRGDPQVKTPASPAHVGCCCGALPAPQGASRPWHAHTGDTEWVQPDASSRRRQLRVSLLLNQTQGAFPDSSRARSGITHRQACSGQCRG